MFSIYLENSIRSVSTAFVALLAGCTCNGDGARQANRRDVQTTSPDPPRARSEWYRAELVFRSADWDGWRREGPPTTGEEVPVPFFIRLPQPGAKATIVNGAEEIEANLVWTGDAATVTLANTYTSVISARRSSDGELTGTWERYNPFWGRGVIPFRATPLAAPAPLERFAAEPGRSATAPEATFSGTWRGTWALLGPGMARLEQTPDGVITGYFQNRHFGDSQHMAGIVRGQQALLSTFDGTNQASLVSMTMKPDGTVEGNELTAGVWHDTFTLERDEAYELPQEVRVRGNRRRLNLPILRQYAGKPVVLVLFATWCPSCLDETPVIKELYDRYHSQGLEVVGRAYDSSSEASEAEAAIQRYRQLFGVEWPIEPVLGTVDDFGTLPPFPDLNGFEALPTTVFINRRGDVHAIHAGFSGPATGAAHERLKIEFRRLIEGILPTE